MLVGGVWAFALIWLVGMFMVEGDMFSTLMIFFVAIFVSLGSIAIDAVKKKS